MGKKKSKKEVAVDLSYCPIEEELGAVVFDDDGGMEEELTIYRTSLTQAEVSKWIFLCEKFGGKLDSVNCGTKEFQGYTLKFRASKFQYYKMAELAKVMGSWRLEKRQDPKFVQMAVEFYIQNGKEDI